MSENSWFKFEDKDYDFPFYNKNPYIPKWGWIILLFITIIGLLLTISEDIVKIILGLLLFILPILYFLKWDYNAIIRKPSRNDILLAIGLFIGYMIYAIIMGLILEQFGIVSPGTVDINSISITTLFTSIFSLAGEEFFKFIPFMFFLRVCYKYSNNRKLSVILSVALVMVLFASVHAFNPVMFVFALIIQGFGSIFEFYGYIKTKNLIIPYITHLLTDEFVFIIGLLGLL